MTTSVQHDQKPEEEETILTRGTDVSGYVWYRQKGHYYLKEKSKAVPFKIKLVGRNPDEDRVIGPDKSSASLQDSTPDYDPVGSPQAGFSPTYYKSEILISKDRNKEASNMVRQNNIKGVRRSPIAEVRVDHERSLQPLPQFESFERQKKEREATKQYIKDRAALYSKAYKASGSPRKVENLDLSRNEERSPVRVYSRNSSAAKPFANINLRD